ncbi:RHS repeat-associated core domain-containing protein [Deminuibacter soli]|uniref:RHS repeat-associated core domain-containing protein n=1 Tax=Deminuibacter soli TaxID=2291815 RepID=UPI001314270F|nr:RHS repeat-associated core domain-containing protein [Deminuibacter soli]
MAWRCQAGCIVVVSSKCRYGFNGQGKSDEIAANTTTAEFWQYDARLGRRWNTDPVPKSMISPYAALGNNPITYVDPLGNDWYEQRLWLKKRDIYFQEIDKEVFSDGDTENRDNRMISIDKKASFVNERIRELINKAKVVSRHK